MIKYAILLLLVFMLQSYVKAGTTIPQSAKDKTRDALLQTQPVKEAKGLIERKAYKELKNYTGIEKKTAATLFAIGYSATQGKVTTKSIKTQIRTGETSTFRPDAEYYFNGAMRGDARLAMNFNYTW